MLIRKEKYICQHPSKFLVQHRRLKNEIIILYKKRIDV